MCSIQVQAKKRAQYVEICEYGELPFYNQSQAGVAVGNNLEWARVDYRRDDPARQSVPESVNDTMKHISS